MPPPSRTRRILKWIGVGLSLAIVVVWIASFRRPMARIRSRHVATEIDSGVIIAVRSEDHHELAFVMSYVYGTALGWRDFGLVPPRLNLIGWWTGNGHLNLILPLWLPLLLTAISTIWLWHRDRRRIRPGHCPRCGYNLTGNTSGVCSECGEAVVAAADTSGR